MKHNKFLHTLESCWLCLRFPFLYPRNRFTGRHRVNVLHRLLSRLRGNSIQEYSITAELEKETNKKKYYHTFQAFMDTKVELKKDENKLVIWNNIEKKEHDLKSLLWKDDIFEILGIEVIFAVLGHPIIRVIIKLKDETDKTNYGFHYEKVELRTNKFKHFWYKVFDWIDSEIIDRILFIPTYTELDALEPGWYKAFGIQLCKELRTQLIKDHYLFKYRITQIKEKWGYLHWYDCGGSKELHAILEKYEDISYKTCIVCGKPATKLTGGWICPYCDEHFPKDHTVYQEREASGEWKVVNENYL